LCADIFFTFSTEVSEIILKIETDIKKKNFDRKTLLILIPFNIVVVKAAQTTRADDDERPALRGIVPSINTFIPIGDFISIRFSFRVLYLLI
jgi:hypothetical protein